MISSVTVTNLRGIKSGTLADLTPLTILVGPNGSGKSTMLDALSIGVSADPARAVGEAVARRLSHQSTARWLFPAQLSGPTEISVPFTHGFRKTALAWSASEIDVTATRSSAGFTQRMGAGTVSFSDTGTFVPKWAPERDLSSYSVEHRLIDMRFGATGAPDLVDVLTAAKAEGRAVFARDLMRAVVPSLENLEILKVGAGFGVALVNANAAVPVAVSGDGIRGLARLCLELAAQAGGLVLVEEPEVHQHPRSLKMSAQAIVAAVKRGIQVVLATHSLELIDSLIEAAEAEAQLEALSVQRLLLNDGLLDAKRFPGEQVRRIRSELELELR